MSDTMPVDVEPLAPDEVAQGGFDIGDAARYLLASLSAAAGAVHLAMVPQHAAQSTIEGVMFAGAGWFQFVAAVLLIAKPSRLLLRLTIIANLAFLAAWAMSRISGLPFGAHAWHPETISSLDLFVVGCEAVLIVGAGLVLVKPSIGTHISRNALAFGSIIPVGVLLASTMAIASPAAQSHSTDAHDGHGDDMVAAGMPADHGAGAGGHDHQATPAVNASDRCDMGFNPAAYWKEADMLGLQAGSEKHLAHPTTFPPASPALQSVIDKKDSDSEVDAAIVVAVLSTLSDDEYHQFLMSLHGSHTPGAKSGDDTQGHGGHQGPQPWVPMTDKASCQKLANQIQQVRELALRYPTAADAKNAGYFQVTTYVPGIAAHWMKFSNVDGTFDMLEPEMILYDGSGLDAHVVGLSYFMLSPGDTEPSKGFAGDNDHYHRHIGLCVKGTLVVGDSTVTKEACEAMGGKKQSGAAGWMSHAWVVPGCESPWGVFSGANPILDKTLSDNAGKNDGACSASGGRKRYDLTSGGSSPAPQSAANSDNAAALSPPR